MALQICSVRDGGTYEKAVPMPLEQEKELVRRAKRGDREAVEALIEQYQGMLWKLALGFETRGERNMTLDDLFQETLVIFIEGLQKFRFKHNCRLMTFMYHHVPMVMRRIVSKASLVCVKSEPHQLSSESRLKAEMARGPVVSLDRKLGDSKTVGGVYLRGFKEDLPAALDLKNESEFLRDILRRLPVRERTILIARMNDVSLRIIAGELGVTTQRVSQLEWRGRTMLGFLMNAPDSGWWAEFKRRRSANCVKSRQRKNAEEPVTPRRAMASA